MGRHREVKKKGGFLVNRELKIGLAKWGLSVFSIICNYLIFGDCGIVFGLALAYVFCRYIK